MRILIDSLQNDSSKEFISFETQVGKGMGVNKTSNIKLEKGKYYDVELDIDLDLELLVCHPSKNMYELNILDEHIVMSGSVEDIEDDMVYFRLAQDCLIMIGTEQKSSLERYSFIQLIVPIINFKISVFGGL